MTNGKEPSGMGVDSSGNPVIDPTENVLQLVAAAIQRQDDLRAAEALLIKENITTLSAVSQAQFAGIEREFQLIESRRVEQKVDTKVAVDAALSAAEKAVKEQTVASEKSIIKSETSAAEQSKQQNATFTAALKGVTDVMADLKERVGKIESRREGSTDLSHTAFTVIGLVLTAISILVIVAIATHGFR